MAPWILIALPFVGSALAALLPTRARTIASVGAAAVALAGLVLLASAFPDVAGGGVIRERFRIKRQMRVISAHGRITGWILVCLPPALGLALTAVNREHRELMFGEALGIQMMIGAAILQSIGALIIRKIINVPY
jgi:hypothetical protein